MTRSSWGLDTDRRRAKVDRESAAATELHREQEVRRFTCPSCGRPPGRCCMYDDSWQERAHTARYLVAAEAGLVPPLPKVPA